MRSCSAPSGPVTVASDIVQPAPSSNFDTLDEAQNGREYFIGDSGIGQLIGGTLDYQPLPLGISVDVLVRAVVCLDGHVEFYDERIAILDCGDFRVTVNRSCLRRGGFELIGVEPVCPVVKGLVSPLGALGVHGDASLDGIGVQIIIRPLEIVKNAVTQSAFNSDRCESNCTPRACTSFKGIGSD